MIFLAEFTSFALTAMFLENIIFSRALGTGRLLALVKRGGNIVPFGLLLTFMTMLASFCTYFLNHVLSNAGMTGRALRPLLFVSSITLVYVLLYLLLRHSAPAFFRKYHIGTVLPFATFNCALLGSAFLAADQDYNLAKTLGFGLGSGVGFLLATLLLCEGKRRLALCNVPKSFRGLPVMLIYLGLIALAMYGLVGHQLPF